MENHKDHKDKKMDHSKMNHDKEDHSNLPADKAGMMTKKTIQTCLPARQGWTIPVMTAMHQWEWRDTTTIK